MSKFSDKADFQVKWHPFQLNPDAPKGQGENKMELYKRKFGADRVAAMLPMMLETGKKDGINFSYGGNTGNTFDSHRLISVAAKQGKEDAMVEELFRNYFEEEKCISDHKVLLAAAEKVGIQNAAAFLAGKDETQDVQSELQNYQGKMRISGVPHFIFNGKISESGAIESQQLQQIFSGLLRE
mmetsp:Transcript_43868/g.129882  ORF Transcript_43868/g.129882 Transcript_43868/m.129882 type:complete len:183 (-) Transcript_43868:117-665(-)